MSVPTQAGRSYQNGSRHVHSIKPALVPMIIAGIYRNKSVGGYIKKFDLWRGIKTMTTSTTTQDSYLLLGQTCIWSSTGSQVCMNSTRITSIHSLLFTPQKPCIGHDSVLQDYIVYFYLHHFARYLYPILQLHMNYVVMVSTPGACQLQVHVNSRCMSTPGTCQLQVHV